VISVTVIETDSAIVILSVHSPSVILSRDSVPSPQSPVPEAIYLILLGVLPSESSAPPEDLT